MATQISSGQIAVLCVPITCFRNIAPRKCAKRRLRGAVTCSATQRASEGSQAMQQIAAAGMAALLAASHPQAALAKDLVASAQGDLLTELLEKNGGKGVKVLKAPKKGDTAPRPAYTPEKPAAAPKAALKPAAAAKKAVQAPAKKAEPIVSAVTEKLKFKEPVKTGTTGVLPKGFNESSLPLPKALKQAQSAAADAAKGAAVSVQSAAKKAVEAVPALPKAAAPAPAPRKEFVNPLLQKRQSSKPAPAPAKKAEPASNPLAPAAAAAGAAAASAGAALSKAAPSLPSAPSVPSPPSLPAAPSIPSVSLPSFGTSQDTAEALGVLAAEVVGAAIASAIVGGITANVPSKKQLKA